MIRVDFVSSLYLGFRLCLVNPQTEVCFSVLYCILMVYICMSFGLVLGLVGVWYIVDIYFC